VCVHSYYIFVLVIRVLLFGSTSTIEKEGVRGTFPRDILEALPLVLRQILDYERHELPKQREDVMFEIARFNNFTLTEEILKVIRLYTF